MHGEERGKCFWWESQKDRDHYEDLECRLENTIKMDLREVGWGAVDWINLAQDKDWWWSIVNIVMNF
jgi:hypothetical protein